MDTLNTGQEKAWFTTVLVDERETQFKLDTGVEVTAITQDTYHCLGDCMSLIKHCMGPLGTLKGCWESSSVTSPMVG